MTLKVISLLQAFSSAIRRTFVQYFTRFQLTARRAVPQRQLGFLLRLHTKSDDFAATVARARQYQDALEQTKIKKPNIRMASAGDRESSSSQIQPVLDRLQRVLETVLNGRGNRARVNCVQRESATQTSNGNGRRSRRDSATDSDRSRSNSRSGDRQRTVRFGDQTAPERSQPTARSSTNYPPARAVIVASKEARETGQRAVGIGTTHEVIGAEVTGRLDRVQQGTDHQTVLDVRAVMIGQPTGIPSLGAASVPGQTVPR